MKTENIKRSVVISAILSCVLFMGCMKFNHNVSYDVKTIKKKAVVHLTEQDHSPTCSFFQEFAYLDDSGNDTIAPIINRNLKRTLWGERFADVPNVALVDSFFSYYVGEYKKDIYDLYLQSEKELTKAEYTPSWFSYEFNQQTFFSDGKEGVLNYQSKITEFRGGAHPNTWHRYLNIDTKTGKLLEKEDVFLSGTEHLVVKLIEDQIVKTKKKLHSERSIHSFKDLAEEGILLIDPADMYIPENFLLSTDGVKFLYNPYEIFPYVEGIIEIVIPYPEISKYMLY